jgi:acetolactate decarboxylase
MRKFGSPVFNWLILFLSFSCNPSSNQKIYPNMVYQNSTINALAEGLYQGDVSFGQLKQYGDLGIGTFQHLDGEMIAFDGRFYQIKSDGSVHEATEDQLTPFSVVTNFKPQQEIQLEQPLTYESLKQYLDKIQPSPNFIYAYRLNGTFTDVVTRSVPEQHTNIRLVDVIPDQAIFEFEGPLKGTMIGFYFPAFMKDINVVGYHFHFLSDDKTKGGHLLDLNLQSAQLKISSILEFQMILPDMKAFRELDLMNVQDSELDTIEKK